MVEETNGWEVMVGGRWIAKEWVHFLTHSFGQKIGHARVVTGSMDTDEYKIPATGLQSLRKQDSEGKSLMSYGLQIRGYKMTALY